MNKKGAIELTLGEMWGIVKAGVIILVILVVFTKMFFFVNPAYAASKSTLERFSEVIKLLGDGESRSVTLDLEKGVWLFGFNKDNNYIEYRKTDILHLCRACVTTLSKPRDCPIGKACLCLCTGDCKTFSSCKVLDDVDYFVVNDIDQDLNGGIKYEYDGKEGNYLAMPGKGIVQVEVLREKNVIYINSFRPEKEQARQEFERFVSFANKNIGVRYRGTCKLVFDFDTEKLTDAYHIMVYANGEAKLFSGQGEQRRNIATKTIAVAPIVNADLDPDTAEQLFDDYAKVKEVYTMDFAIAPNGNYVLDVDENILENSIVFLQKNGNGLWTNIRSRDFFNDCEQE